MTDNTPTAEKEISTIPFDAIPYFSERDIAYVKDDPRLDSFRKYRVNPEEFIKVFRDKQHDNTDRDLLVSVLRKQYKEIDALDDYREEIIEKLRDENTFTITTAHQPCLFTGPLYVVYKIIAAINAARKLNEIYPDKTVLPVYIIGGEDHDFEEINNTYIFNQRFEWKNENALGAIGRMSTESMQPVLDQLKEMFSSDERATPWVEMMSNTYLDSENYGIASRKIIHNLFKDTELLVLGMDEYEFKHAFIDIISREVLKQYSAPYVREAQEELHDAGFSEQAYVRDINFFYLNEEGRNRIEFENNKFLIVDTDIEFSVPEMVDEIHKHPERFSPNVVMRPIYQEFILPNLAYIGGGGELAYWMERKRQFEAFDLNFPMLIRRNSLIIMDKRAVKDLEYYDLTIEELFTDIEELVKDYTRENSNGNVSLSEQKKNMNQLFKDIADQAYSVDKSLRGFVNSQEASVMKMLGHIEGKMMKAEKDRLAVELNKLRNLKERVFPGNGLQERQDNFLSWVIRYGDEFWDALYDSIDVFDDSVRVIRL